MRKYKRLKQAGFVAAAVLGAGIMYSGLKGYLKEYSNQREVAVRVTAFKDVLGYSLENLIWTLPIYKGLRRMEKNEK